MAMIIEVLRGAVTAIVEAVDWLTKQFSGEVEKQPTEESAAKPEPKPHLTLEQVRAVLADKSYAGHTAAVRELLLKYGASKLSQIDPANHEALLREGEVLGDAT